MQLLFGALSPPLTTCTALKTVRPCYKQPLYRIALVTRFVGVQRHSAYHELHHQPIAHKQHIHRAQKQEQPPTKLEPNQIQLPKPRRSMQVTFTCNKCGMLVHANTQSHRRGVDQAPTLGSSPCIITTTQRHGPSAWSTPLHGSEGWCWRSATIVECGTNCKTTVVCGFYWIILASGSLGGLSIMHARGGAGHFGVQICMLTN